MKRWLKVTIVIALALLILGCVIWGVSWALGARPSLVFNDNTLNLPNGVHMSFGDSYGGIIYDDDDDRHGFGSGHIAGHVTENGTYNVSIDGIRGIEIDWISGSVDVAIGQGDAIVFSETVRGSQSAVDSGQTLRYTIKEGTLIIQYCASGISFGNMDSKDLSITIPDKLASSLTDFEFSSTSASLTAYDLKVKNEFVFDSTSGKLSVENIQAQELSASTVSGDIELTGCSIGELSTDTTSGTVFVSGSVNDVDADTISGKVELNLENCPHELEAGSTSGSIKLYLPADSSFSLTFDTVSGSFNCDFAATYQDGRCIVGNGGAEFSVDTVSGSLKIIKE